MQSNRASRLTLMCLRMLLDDFLVVGMKQGTGMGTGIGKGTGAGAVYMCMGTGT